MRSMSCQRGSEWSSEDRAGGPFRMSGRASTGSIAACQLYTGQFDVNHLCCGEQKISKTFQIHGAAIAGLACGCGASCGGETPNCGRAGALRTENERVERGD